MEPYAVNLTKRKPEFSSFKKTKITTHAAFNSAEETNCPASSDISTHDSPLINSTTASTAQKTWPQINYEKAIPVEPTNEKSTALNNELLPILNKLYDNQVKLSDNMGGSMLSYTLGRTVVKDDLTSVKNYLTGLGYKLQDETQYQLTVYKVGYFLNLSFSVNNTYKAFLNVTY